MYLFEPKKWTQKSRRSDQGLKSYLSLNESNCTWKGLPGTFPGKGGRFRGTGKASSVEPRVPVIMVYRTWF